MLSYYSLAKCEIGQEDAVRKIAVVAFVLGALVGAGAVAGLQSAKSESDPVKLSPQYYKVRIDNDRVRVLEYHLPAGQREPMHTHPPGIVYYTSDATFRTTQPDGSVHEAPGKAGDLIWRDATTHASENVGSTEAGAIAVELKPCRQ